MFKALSIIKQGEQVNFSSFLDRAKQAIPENYKLGDRAHYDYLIASKKWRLLPEVVGIGGAEVPLKVGSILVFPDSIFKDHRDTVGVLTLTQRGWQEGRLINSVDYFKEQYFPIFNEQ